MTACNSARNSGGKAAICSGVIGGLAGDMPRAYTMHTPASEEQFLKRTLFFRTTGRERLRRPAPLANADQAKFQFTVNQDRSTSDQARAAFLFTTVSFIGPSELERVTG